MKQIIILCLAGMASIASAATASNTLTNTLNPGEAVFAGTVIECSPPSQPGAPDCCTSTDWKSNPALKKCTSPEQALAVARQHGLAVYLGQNCPQGTGACPAPVSVYCVFADKVTYKVQTAGRQQLGLGFGTAASPDCGGLTPAQMQKINLNKIRFGDQPYQSIM